MMSDNGQWVTRGFDAFRRGAFGNGGQNLYVSRAGILQRIHLFDLNKDGYLDLVFCNTQDFHESPPAYVYRNALDAPERTELFSDGSPGGIVADLNGDGYADLVLGMQYNGIRRELNSFIYYGSPEGLTERYHSEIPTPWCTSVAAGDFNGDGRVDLAMICNGKLRIFCQGELGFEPREFVDLEVDADQLGAADLDGDGYADLYVLKADEPPRVFWGGADGIDPERFSELPVVPDTGAMADGEAEKDIYEDEWYGGVIPLAQVVRLPCGPHLFVSQADEALLVPVSEDRGFGDPLRFACGQAFSVATGDINGNGHTDLAFAARDQQGSQECSWVYWGGPDGFDESRRQPLPSSRACDVAVGDLNHSGCDDVVVCQYSAETSFSIDSLVFRGTPQGVSDAPVKLPTEGARRVFVARTSDDPDPQVIFINARSGGVRGDAGPVIYIGDADGFSPDRYQELKGIGAATALGCDLNDDGYADVLITNCAENALSLDPGSYVFAGGPEGFSSQPDTVMPTKMGWGIAVADLNRNGYLDVVVAQCWRPELLVFHGTANGLDTENPQRIRTVCDGMRYQEPRRIYLADLNNDGWLDLVVSQTLHDRCFILWGGPEGFSFERRRMLPIVNGSSPQAADLTGNGYLDLVMATARPGLEGPHDMFLHIYWNGPQGLRDDRRMMLPCHGTISTAIADFNGNGCLDIFVGSYHSGRERDLDSFIYWGEPGGGFSRHNVTPLRTHSVSGCVTADFNEDGWMDLAICNHKTLGDHVGDSYVWLNGPDGFHPDDITRLPTRGAHGMTYVQPGNILDRGPDEYYVSEPFELPAGASLRRINWQSELPPKTWVRAQLRSADAAVELDRTAWQGPDGADGWFESGGAIDGAAFAGRFIQYRLALGAVNGGNTPRVSEVCVEYG